METLRICKSVEQKALKEEKEEKEQEEVEDLLKTRRDEGGRRGEKEVRWRH